MQFDLSNLDPTKWLVSLAGFVYDWMITREWVRTFFSLSPLVLMVVLIVAVWSGGRLNRSQLANWYLGLADQEAAGWEQSWAPTSQAAATESASGEVEPLAEGADSAANTKSEADKSASDEGLGLGEISSFTEVLFRRVQMLEPTVRSQYFVGATLAQRGALARGTKLLKKIAPDDREGYAPAHAILALIYGQQMRAQPNPNLAAAMGHHALVASAWERVPVDVLMTGGLYFRAKADKATAYGLLEKAAEREPKYFSILYAWAKEDQNDRLAVMAAGAGLEVAKRNFEDDPTDATARAILAEAILRQSESFEACDKAEQLLREVDFAKSDVLSRALSEVYRFRFIVDLRDDSDGKENSADVTLLDRAMQIDPSNPKIPEQVALMARAGTGKPTQELIEQLQKFLAEGRATALTHLWLSEVYLVRGNFEKALPHMEQVAIRSPGQPANLNNLAFVLAETRPERLEESLKMVQQAIAIVNAKKEPNANFYDTFGLILLKLNRPAEAVAAMETAIQLERYRIDFHERIREAYLATGNADMAGAHERQIEAIKKMIADEQAKALAKQEAAVQEAAVQEAAVQEAAVQPANGQAAAQPNASESPADAGAPAEPPGVAGEEAASGASVEADDAAKIEAGSDAVDNADPSVENAPDNSSEAPKGPR